MRALPIFLMTLFFTTGAFGQLVIDLNDFKFWEPKEKREQRKLEVEARKQERMEDFKNNLLNPFLKGKNAMFSLDFTQKNRKREWRYNNISDQKRDELAELFVYSSFPTWCVQQQIAGLREQLEENEAIEALEDEGYLFSFDIEISNATRLDKRWRINSWIQVKMSAINHNGVKIEQDFSFSAQQRRSSTCNEDAYKKADVGQFLDLIFIEEGKMATFGKVESSDRNTESLEGESSDTPAAAEEGSEATFI